MRIKNTTPYAVGAIATSRDPATVEMVTIVRGVFDLVHEGVMRVAMLPGPDPAGALTGDVHEGEDGDPAAELAYPSDFADFKPRADVLLTGSAHAPGGTPVKEIGVRFGVGSWSKTLRVVGPRAWSDASKNAALSAPLTFTSAKLGWSNAWGGPDDPANPAGVGRVGTSAAPQVQLPDQPILDRRFDGSAAGFGPFSSLWRLRRDKVGTEYGPAYRQKRMRSYARDFDWSHFNAAPADQQLPYLRGDEEIVAQNLHPSIPVFRTKLPGKRVRVFARGDGGTTREVELHLDTLFVDMTERRAHLVWRGLLPVTRRSLDDVPFLYVACEELAAPPREREGYEIALAKYAADPLERDQYVPPGYEELAATDRPAENPPTANDADIPGEEAVSRLLDQKLGNRLGPQKAELRDFVARALRAVSPAANAGAMLADAVRKAPNAAGGAAFATAGGLDAKSQPRIPLSTLLRQVSEKVREARSALAQSGQDDPELARLAKIADDPRMKALDPGLGREKPRPEPGPGVDFSDQDLRGEAFVGHDLTGANFSGAILQGVKFDGAKLDGALFEDAILYEASFAGASLRDAKFVRTNAAAASFDRAVLDGAKIERSVFDKAVFQGASLHGVKIEFSTFGEAKFGAVTASRLELADTSLDSADLTGVLLEGIHIDRCIVAAVFAEGASFSRAHVTNTTFLRSKLSRARFDDATVLDTSFVACELDGADFSYATAPRTYFLDARIPGGKFVGADLARARFNGAKLTEADFSGANLFQADLSDAALARAKFGGANLYNARMFGAGGEGASFSGANLKRILPEPG